MQSSSSADLRALRRTLEPHSLQEAPQCSWRLKPQYRDHTSRHIDAWSGSLISLASGSHSPHLNQRSRTLAHTELAHAQARLEKWVHRRLHSSMSDAEPERLYASAQPSRSHTSAVEWTVADVVHWLQSSVGLPQYSDVFCEHELEGPQLLSLDNLDLLAMGLKHSGHRKRILAAISELSLLPPALGAVGRAAQLAALDECMQKVVANNPQMPLESKRLVKQLWNAQRILCMEAWAVNETLQQSATLQRGARASKKRTEARAAPCCGARERIETLLSQSEKAADVILKLREKLAAAVTDAERQRDQEAELAATRRDLEELRGEYLRLQHLLLSPHHAFSIADDSQVRRHAPHAS